MATAIERIDPHLTGLNRGGFSVPSPLNARLAGPSAPALPPFAPAAAVPLPPASRAEPAFLAEARAADSVDFRADLSSLGDSIQAARGRTLLSPRSAASGPLYASPAAAVQTPLAETAGRISAALNQANALKVLEKAALDLASRQQGGIGGMMMETLLVDIRI